MSTKLQKGVKINCLEFIKFLPLEYNGVTYKQKSIALWKCDCGKEVVKEVNAVVSGNTKSCGCLRKKYYSNNTNKHLMEGLTFVEGTQLERIKSDTLNKNNKSGTKGVWYSPVRKKWVGGITFQGKRYRKDFNDKESAIAYRKTLERMYFEPVIEKYKTT